jgi:hypothetical protein
MAASSSLLSLPIKLLGTQTNFTHAMGSFFSDQANPPIARAVAVNPIWVSAVHCRQKQTTPEQAYNYDDIYRRKAALHSELIANRWHPSRLNQAIHDWLLFD